MLSVAPKGRVEPAIDLSVEEDRHLRRAFGRFGNPAERRSAAEIVRRWQCDGPGHWILCDCLGVRGDDDRRPALVPVAEAHLRRHIHGSWPPHAPDCDFYRDPDEQRRTTLTYRRTDHVEPVIRGFDRNDTGERVRFSRISHADDRPRLARLMMRLVQASGISTVWPGWNDNLLPRQYRMLRAAAKEIRLTSAVRLSTYLETFPPHYEMFRARIEAVPASKFKGSRPHGVMIFAARQISEGVIDAGSGQSLPVAGRISVFGEIEGHGRIGDRAIQRPPYLVAALVARPSAEDPAAILRAYAHPIASAYHLIPVDSDYERRTLKRLMSVQRWLLQTRNVVMSIEKPLFDIGPLDEDVGDGDGDEGRRAGVDRAQAAGGGQGRGVSRGSRPPIIPDFVVRAKSAQGLTATVIVETMGYDDEVYRERKMRLHPMMREALNQAPLVQHICHHAGSDPQLVDQAMGREVLRFIFQQIEPPGSDPTSSRVGVGPSA
jgi:hypothetical protein